MTRIALALALALLAACTGGVASAQEAEDRPDTTVSGRAGTTVRFTARVPSDRLDCDPDAAEPGMMRVVNGWCRHVMSDGSNYHAYVEFSSCRGPFTLNVDPVDDEAPLDEDGNPLPGLIGVSMQGRTITVDVLPDRETPIELTYLFIGQRTVRHVGGVDPQGRRIITTQTADCSLQGLARINVTQPPGAVYGYTPPTDFERYIQGERMEWIVVTPVDRGEGRRPAYGYTDPQCADCQVGTGNGDLIRVGDLPICPTLPQGERPGSQCRARR